MEYLVCVKLVPRFPNKVKLDPVTNNLIRDGVTSVINPADLNALTMALDLRRITGGKVSVLSMGIPDAINSLKQCIARGADKAYLVTDGSFRGSDTLATSYTLAMAAKHIGNFDLIFTGTQTTDGDTGQVGPELAELLGVNQASYVKLAKYKDGSLTVLRSLYNGTEKQSVKTPALISVVKNANEPAEIRKSILEKVKDEDVVILNASDIKADSEKIGASGSATQVVRTFQDEELPKGEYIKGSAQEQVDSLIEIFKERQFI